MSIKKTRLVPLLANLILCLAPFLPTIAVQAEDTFKVNARAAFAVNTQSGKALYDQDGEKTMGITSITRIIGLYIVLDQAREGKLSWDDRVSISDYVENLSITPDLSSVPLHKEDTYTVKELFGSAIIQSASASMMALTEKISGSGAKLVERMKEQLRGWEAKDTTIVNASGLSNSYLGENRPEGTGGDDENQMSAQDVTIAARHLILDFPEILDASSTTTQMFGENTQSPVEVINQNWMLPGFVNHKEGMGGLKTGTTELAGACFVGTITKNDQRIITVVLNADGHAEDPSARLDEADRLMDYCYDNQSEKELGRANTGIPSLKTIDIKDRKESTVPVVLKGPVKVWVRSDMNTGKLTITPTLDKKQVTDNEIQAPMDKGTKIDIATTTLTDDKLGYLENNNTPSTEIITDRTMKKVNMFVIDWRRVAEFFGNLF